MAWISVNPFVPWPWPIAQIAGYAVDTSSTQRRGVVGIVPKSGNIVGVVCRIWTANTESSAQVGLYTVDTSTGFPTTTNYKGSSDATFAPTPTGITTITLSSPAVNAQRGDIIAVVFRWNGASGSYYLAGSSGSNFPYEVAYNAGTSSWSKTSSFRLCVGLVYDGDGTYYRFGSPIGATFEASFNSSSSPNQRGNLLQFPFGIRFTLVYVMAATGGARRISVLDANNNELAYAVIPQNNDSGNIWVDSRIPLSQTVTIDANTPFRIVVIPQTTTNVSYLRGLEFLTAAARTTWDLGTDVKVQATWRTGNGAWSVFSNQAYYVFPVIEAIELPSSAAGGFPFPPHVVLT